MANKLKLSVIIVNYNTKTLLRQCLKSVISHQSSVISYELIVVDNSSTDGSVAMVEKEFPSVKLIKNKENLGFAKANNQAIRFAQGRNILLLNSDTVVYKGALDSMVEFLDNHPEVGVVGPKLLNEDKTAQPSAGRFPSLPVVIVMLFKEHFGGSRFVRASYDKIREVDWVMGAAMMVKKEILKKTGLLDENIFMYMEEVEWCYRIKKAGFKVYFYPQAKITHLGGASSRTGRQEPILNIYKGLVFFYEKHKSGWEEFILRILLKIKAFLAYVLGLITNNQYLKETYAQAYHLA
jgi:GT2 family glycosyltransferase